MLAMQWVWVAAAALGTAAILWQESQKHNKQGQAEEVPTSSKRNRSKRQAATAVAPPTAPAAAGVPLQELQQLQGFLQKVCCWRGWQGGRYHVTQAWHAADAAAAAAAAGAWQPDFDSKQMTDDNCDALLRVVDVTSSEGNC
ncbi:hypothetical protein COO60DRAFT_53597 [Scenedesmus sp. NREL 46B-D3]|nr:hypothetical protein COO60DRAFT_53597 [Scenedesmus sp. NREL 46B-D3]